MNGHSPEVFPQCTYCYLLQFQQTCNRQHQIMMLWKTGIVEPGAVWVHKPKVVVCMYVFSYLPRNSGTMFAQPLGPCVRAAEGTA